MTFGYSPFIRFAASDFWKLIWEPNPLPRDAGLQEKASVRVAKAVAVVGYSYGLLHSTTKQTVNGAVPDAKSYIAPAVINVKDAVNSNKNCSAAVVIPALILDDKQLSKLRITLDCIRGQSIEPDAVFLVDDGSPIPIVDQLDAEDLRGVMVIRCKHRGPAAARNKGLRAARRRGMDYVCFTDADCLPESTWLESMKLHFMNNPSDDLIGGMTQSLNRSAVDLFHDVYGTLNGRVLPDQTLLYTPSCNMGIRSKKVPVTFSSDFSEAAYEDIDFCIRARNSGATLKLVETARVRHDYDPSFVGLFRMFSRYGRSEQTLLNRHPSYFELLHVTKSIPVKRLLRI